MAQQSYSSEEGVAQEGVQQEGASDSGPTPPPPVDSIPVIRRIILVTGMYDASRLIGRKGI